MDALLEKAIPADQKIDLNPNETVKDSSNKSTENQDIDYTIENPPPGISIWTQTGCAADEPCLLEKSGKEDKHGFLRPSIEENMLRRVVGIRSSLV